MIKIFNIKNCQFRLYKNVLLRKYYFKKLYYFFLFLVFPYFFCLHEVFFWDSPAYADINKSNKQVHFLDFSEVKDIYRPIALLFHKSEGIYEDRTDLERIGLYINELESHGISTTKGYIGITEDYVGSDVISLVEIMLQDQIRQYIGLLTSLNDESYSLLINKINNNIEIIKFLFQKWYAEDLSNRTMSAQDLFKVVCEYPRVLDHEVFKDICSPGITFQKIACDPSYKKYRDELIDLGVEELRYASSSSCVLYSDHLHAADISIKKVLPQSVHKEILIKESKACRFDPDHDFKRALLETASTVTLYVRSGNSASVTCEFIGGKWEKVPGRESGHVALSPCFFSNITRRDQIHGLAPFITSGGVEFRALILREVGRAVHL